VSLWSVATELVSTDESRLGRSIVSRIATWLRVAMAVSLWPRRLGAVPSLWLHSDTWRRANDSDVPGVSPRRWSLKIQRLRIVAIASIRTRQGPCRYGFIVTERPGHSDAPGLCRYQAIVLRSKWRRGSVSLWMRRVTMAETHPLKQGDHDHDVNVEGRSVKGH